VEKGGKSQPGGVRGKANLTTSERELAVVDSQAHEKYYSKLKLSEVVPPLMVSLLIPVIMPLLKVKLPTHPHLGLLIQEPLIT